MVSSCGMLFEKNLHLLGSHQILYFRIFKLTLRIAVSYSPNCVIRSRWLVLQKRLNHINGFFWWAFGKTFWYSKNAIYHLSICCCCFIGSLFIGHVSCYRTIRYDAMEKLWIIKLEQHRGTTEVQHRYISLLEKFNFLLWHYNSKCFSW